MILWTWVTGWLAGNKDQHLPTPSLLVSSRNTVSSWKVDAVQLSEKSPKFKMRKNTSIMECSGRYTGTFRGRRKKVIIRTRNLNENFWGQSTKWRNAMRSWWWKVNNRTKCEIQKFLLAHTNKLFFPASRVSKELRIRYKNNYKISRGTEEAAFSILAGLLCHNKRPD